MTTQKGQLSLASDLKLRLDPQLLRDRRIAALAQDRVSLVAPGARGGGSDVINEDTDGGDTDTLTLTGINPADVSVLRTGTGGSDIVLKIKDSVVGAGDGARIRLNGTWANDSGRGVDRVKSADGTIWNVATIRSKISTSASTGDDYITGTSAANTIDALAGGDSVFSLGGNDSLTAATATICWSGEPATTR